MSSNYKLANYPINQLMILVRIDVKMFSLKKCGYLLQNNPNALFSSFTLLRLIITLILLLNSSPIICCDNVKSGLSGATNEKRQIVCNK